MTRRGRERNPRAETYEVTGGELVLNGDRLSLPEGCVGLCLARHGLDASRDHVSLPPAVGRHILRIGAFVKGVLLCGNRDVARPSRRN